MSLLPVLRRQSSIASTKREKNNNKDLAIRYTAMLYIYYFGLADESENSLTKEERVQDISAVFQRRRQILHQSSNHSFPQKAANHNAGINGIGRLTVHK
jgi:hypothetical protein